MNRRLFILVMAVAFAPGFVTAQDTAYKALRVVGAQRGEKALNQVTAIVGQSGRPQPAAWRVVLDDPAPGGGVSIILRVVEGNANWISWLDKSPPSVLQSGLPRLDQLRLT